MTRLRRAWLLAGVLLVSSSGCALLQDDAPTIGSLSKHPVRLQDTAIEANEVKAMNAYRDFLETDDRTEARPQAMRRLADLNLDAEELPQAGQSHNEATSLYPEQVSDSIRLYNAVLAQYPERADNDHVLYQLARAYERNAQAEQSLATLVRLIDNYPQSKYLPEAQFRRGEILFVKRDYRGAELAYRNVVVAGEVTPFYRQSLYKLGWCYFKQSLFDEGLDAFVTLLDLQLQDTAAGAARFDHLGRAERELLDDSLRVVSLSFSYQSGPLSVSDYFRRRGARDYEDVVYDRLGLLYLQKERYTDAAQTFQAFVEHNPDHVQAPQFQMRVIETYREGEFPTLVLEAKQQFVERYNLQSDYWQHHDPEAAGEVIGFLKITLTDLAQHYHALAQRNRKAADYRQAVHWYRIYLASFPDGEETPQLHFLLAELLFESGEYAAAAAEYIHTAYDYGEHAGADAAGYAAVLAFERREQQLSGKDRATWHRQSIENALRFAGSFPQHPQALAVLTRTSEQLLVLEDHERALLVAQQVTGSATATADQQRVAWTVAAHAWFDLEDYLQAEQAYQQVLVHLDNNAKNRAAMIEKLAAAIYKQGEAAQAAGDTAAAVDHFLRVRTAAPAADIVATAEYDAAAGLMSLQRWADAAQVLDRFRKAWPDDPRQGEVTRRLATAYLAEQQPLQAAVEFERIGNTQADPVLRREALWQSAELYAQAQHAAQAVKVYTTYIDQFPQPLEPAVEARQRIAEHFQSRGDIRQQQAWLNKIITADAAGGDSRTDRTRYLAANARFRLAEAAYNAYRAVALTLPLKQSLAARKQRMEAALHQYEQAADYQVAGVTTAAAFRTADIYLQMGKALLESQRPANLSGEALDQYNLLLEEQAYPFEEQAIALHETNIERMNNGLYDDWIEKSLAQLAELVPARYAKQERSVAYVEAID
ncbi:MAG: tetratricopeptide repeat protein [Gammaproteobacteria bacterium]|nr:tetratricopeptide repeat protein [Gammaproteobacteria bacterium]